MRILWIPHAAWRTPQRAKTFCEKLSERHEVHVTDYDAEFGGLGDYISTRYFKNYFYRKRQEGKITIHHIPRISPSIFSKTLREINYGFFSRYVKKIIEEHDIDSVIGTFVCKPPKVDRLVFDLFDDNPAFWKEFGKVKSYADEIEAVEKEYTEKADEIVAVSSILAEKIGRDVHLIPNGVDLNKFKNGEGEKIRNKLNLNGNIAGFISSFGEFSGLLKLVKSSELINEDLTFLIVGTGPMINDAKRYIKRKNIKNFVFTGFVDPNEIHDYFSAIDIGLLPFNKRWFTDSACPIKLLEYTAAGKPVVSTDLEEVKRMNFSNVIMVKDNPESLAEGIEKAINTKVEIPEKIKDYDMDKLVAEYEKVLEK
jgi:glycosyltransferase involved in cell wall biosynthesis